MIARLSAWWAAGLAAPWHYAGYGFVAGALCIAALWVAS
jgi:hypothetical protein